MSAQMYHNSLTTPRDQQNICERAECYSAYVPHMNKFNVNLDRNMKDASANVSLNQNKSLFHISAMDFHGYLRCDYAVQVLCHFCEIVLQLSYDFSAAHLWM